MRVLHVTGGLSPHYGGTTALLQMCRDQRRAGIDAAIATTDADTEGRLHVPLRQRVEKNGAAVWYFPSLVFRKYGFSPELSEWLKQTTGQFDLLHIHGFFSYAAWSAIAAASEVHVPYVIRPMGQLASWFMDQRNLKKILYLGYCGRTYLENAAAVHCTSEQEYADIRKLGLRTRGAVIPLAFEIGGNELLERGHFRARHGVLNDRKLILFLSRLDPHKGLDLLLAATSELRTRRDDFVLVVAGAGEPKYERAFRNRVKSSAMAERTLIVGFVSGSEKEALLADADIFVLPSYGENFGMAIVEAMAAGIPVVVSDRVGIHQEIAKAGAGLIADQSAEGIASALERLAADGPFRRRTGENAKRLVEELFDWQKITPRLLDLYSSIVQPSAHPQDGSSVAVASAWERTGV